MNATQEVHEEPTLSESLHSVAYTRLPTQFYQLLQLAIPFAVQFWSYGLHRTAGCMTVVSLFGIWAHSVTRLEGTGAKDPRCAWTRIAAQPNERSGRSTGWPPGYRRLRALSLVRVSLSGLRWLTDRERAARYSVICRSIRRSGTNHISATATYSASAAYWYTNASGIAIK